MITVQFMFNGVSNELMEFVEKQCTPWEVLPGQLLFEMYFNTLEEVVKFMYKCERVYNKQLKFVLEPLPKDKEDDVDIFLITITDAKLC